jgi:hypothetical protein
MNRLVLAAAGRFLGLVALAWDGGYLLLPRVTATRFAAGSHFFIDFWRDFFQNFQESCDRERKEGQRARKWSLRGR